MTLVLVCLLGVRVVRIKSWGRSGFGGLTVLVARSGNQVSFNTTVGDQTLNYQLIGLEDPQVSHLH